MQELAVNSAKVRTEKYVEGDPFYHGSGFQFSGVAENPLKSLATKTGATAEAALVECVVYVAHVGVGFALASV